MDKIYPLLPWLTIDQSTDWIRRLTNSPLTETDLIRLCDADQCAIYVDVGPSKFGSDEQTWLFEVVGSGYQRVTNPKALISPTIDKKLILELHGQIFWTDENGTAKSGEFDWFSTFELSDVFPIFKSPSIKALAEKINAEEIADTERELKQLRASAESDRQAKELAMLRAQDAEAELGELRQKIILADEKAEVYRSIAKDMRGVEGDLIHQLQQERSTRLSLESEVLKLRKSHGDVDNEPLSKRERNTYDRLIYVLAHEAGYRMEKPYSDEGAIRLYAEMLGVKVPTGKGVIAKRLTSACTIFDQDRQSFSDTDYASSKPNRELAQPSRT